MFHPTRFAVRMDRLNHGLVNQGLERWATAVERCVQLLTHLHRDPHAVIGRDLCITHWGVRVGPGCVIGDRCTLFNNVIRGQGHGGDPRLGHAVRVYSNAVIAGRVTVGDHAIVSACSLLKRDVPPGALAAGVPASTRRPDASHPRHVSAAGTETSGQRAGQTGTQEEGGIDTFGPLLWRPRARPEASGTGPRSWGAHGAKQRSG